MSAMSNKPTLKFYNTLTRSKEDFSPIDENNVRMYVCGPTVYDYAHIGNARPAIVFDVLFRLLRHVYGEGAVTYVRNITDVDDKINARALRDFPDLPLNEAIGKVTEKTASQYFSDMKALGCLEPTVQPRATEHIDGMVAMIQTLIDKGNAYLATGKEGREVLFSVGSMPSYGQLSNRKLEDQQAGARVAVEEHKRNPADFVLWKESDPDQPGWLGSFRENGTAVDIHGRPGWHIECSVMSEAHLGETFDIHGGGLDLIFPHHENEIAQSSCAHGNHRMANVWMHNGFLQVEGQKMSKSLGNFVTVNELLATEKFGGRTWHGGVLRLALLKTHYREPLDFTVSSLLECRNDLERFYYAGSHHNAWAFVADWLNAGLTMPYPEVIEVLTQDLNTPLAINILRQKAGSSSNFNQDEAIQFAATVRFLNLMNETNAGTYSGIGPMTDAISIASLSMPNFFVKSENLRVAANNSIQQTVSSIVTEFENEGLHVVLETDGNFNLEVVSNDQGGSHKQEFEKAISKRLAFIANKNWGEADRIRDELLAQGIQLKDGKDTETGERVTTWEVKR